MSQDDWDTFDFESWGRGEVRDGANGHGDETARRLEPDFQPGQPDDEAGWVSQGGILRWIEPGDEEIEKPGDPRSEARSRWASETVDLPPGAPDSLRLRSLRAWLLRQRLLETEAVGQLLLERRRQEANDDAALDVDFPGGEGDDSPFELELVKRQAAIEVYEALVESLDEMVAHSGPARVLVEYYLWLGERLALLASTAPIPLDAATYSALAPTDIQAETTQTPADRQPEARTTARSIAAWQGRAQAALQARRRIEQVSSPEPEE